MLVVSDVCVREHSAGAVRNRSTRGAERLVGRFTAGATVGVEEKEVEVESSRTQMFYSTLLTSPMT